MSPNSTRTKRTQKEIQKLRERVPTRAFPNPINEQSGCSCQSQPLSASNEVLDQNESENNPEEYEHEEAIPVEFIAEEIIQHEESETYFDNGMVQFSVIY